MRVLFAAFAVLLLSFAALVAPRPAEATHGTWCSANLVTGANWDFCWQLDNARGQGLEVNYAFYQHKQVFHRVGVPFTHTFYPSTNVHFKDVLGTTSSTVPGYGQGAMTIGAGQCPRFLNSGTLVGGGKVCVEHDTTAPDRRVAVWARFNVYNYRFIQGYLFHEDGSVDPLLLLGGNLYDLGNSPCSTGGGSSCRTHFHYLYWRFDVDLDGWTNDRFQEFALGSNSPTNQNVNTACPVPAGSSWCSFGTETSRTRDYSKYMRWRVVDFNSLNGKNHPRSIELYSNSQGPSDASSTREVWSVRYKGDSTEIGYQVPQNPTNDAAITAYANNEGLNPGDVVVWHAEKVHHEPRDEEQPSMMYHTAGPQWRIRNFLTSNNVESSHP